MRTEPPSAVGLPVAYVGTWGEGMGDGGECMGPKATAPKGGGGLRTSCDSIVGLGDASTPPVSLRAGVSLGG